MTKQAPKAAMQKLEHDDRDSARQLMHWLQQLLLKDSKSCPGCTTGFTGAIKFRASSQKLLLPTLQLGFGTLP